MRQPSPNQFPNGDEPWRRLPLESLKRCPLCDAINARSNGECFVCTWHGGFDHDHVAIQQGLDELMDRLPGLYEEWPVAVGGDADPSAGRPGFFTRIRRRFRSLLRSRLDLRV